MRGKCRNNTFFKIGLTFVIFVFSTFLIIHDLSAIRQKDESQNRCYKKTKHAKFSEKQTFLTP